jgi:hypothetical protein
VIGGRSIIVTTLNWQRKLFWETAKRNLDQAGVTGDVRARIIATLESVIPRPDEASEAAAAEELRSPEVVLTRFGIGK